MTIPPSSAPGRARRVFRTALCIFLAAVLSIAVLLVVLELGFRLTKAQTTFALTVNTWDPSWGTTHIPGERGFLNCPSYEIDLIINSKGLRDREFPYEKPQGTRRILCLGDSFVCGYGVQAEETVAKVLERLLNGEHGNRRWEVLNAGVGSTGTAHHLAWFVDEGFKYQPDIVVLGFFSANDFIDDIYSGLYTVDGDSLVRHEAPCTRERRIQRLVQHLPGFRSLFARSHLLNFVKYRVAALHMRSLGRAAEDRAGATGRDTFDDSLTRRLMATLRDRCREKGCRLAVFNIPTGAGGSPSRPVGDFLDFTRGLGVPCLDLSPFFTPEAGLTTYPGEGHWTVLGHRLAARHLLDFLERAFAPDPGAIGEHAAGGR